MSGVAYFPATLSSLIANVRRFIEDMPAGDSITSPILATPAGGTVTIAVNDVAQWPVASRVEIDDELFFVLTNPGGSGAGSVTAQRAYESTTAAAHTTGTQTVRDPRFLKANIRESINVVVHDWCSYYFPQLVWDTTVGGTFNPIKWIVPSSADCLSVERVTWKVPGFQRYVNIPHSSLRMVPSADVTNPQTFVAGGVLGFEIYEQGLPGVAIEVLYGKRWPYLSLDADTVPLDFPEDAQDLIHEGAVLYLTGWRMIPKFQTADVIFHRESAVPIPTNANVKLLEIEAQNWQMRARQVRARRPIAWPKKEYVGYDA